jgi:3-hydroxyacyl-CoA dehydrogenase/enoyl-CoA hydratase/3-hydroxybutyryl-CoA epimerase/enoyl-CoA isomerase
VPSVVAINGTALGGGFEYCLAHTYRVMSTDAQVGLPETKLGIYPGWGGTIRLSRLIGADNAIEWIAGGTYNKHEAALNVGAVDVVVAPDEVRNAALELLQDCITGKLDWRAKRQEKLEPLKLRSPVEGMMVFQGARGFVAAKAGPHYPAPIAAINAMERGAGDTRDDAIKHEIKGFVKMAKTHVAECLVSIFLSDQFNKKKSKGLAKEAAEVKQAAVLGAGIMGGGVAYQSASKGTPIVMKDIAEPALALGMGEAQKLLGKQLKRKKIDAAKLGEIVSIISPTLSYGDFGNVDIVVEAVVENEKIKKSVLAEVEAQVRQGTILTSNTSTISITKLAEGLKHPENFCGMHFFNPVHMMPLVEVIRGEKSSAKAIATTVAYAYALGKTPVVVNDCAGFLVNRILFPYFGGMAALLADGVDFKRIDKIMEKFGWPMGPAYLGDVVGLDTAVHAGHVMAEAYPDRMQFSDDNPMSVMVAEKRHGQKNLKGFYKYEIDKKGKPRKLPDPDADAIVAKLAKETQEVSDEEIVERMMIPMINESVRCLEDKIVDTPMEVDLGLVFGLGFPPFRGGALKYADSIGLDQLCKKASAFSRLGKRYEPAPLLKQMAESGKSFYQL